MGFLVLNPGVFATIQDGGRPGLREWGVSVGGAFDRGASDLANALLGNPPGCATLELTLVGGVYRAEIPLGIALAGAPMAATILGRGGDVRPLEVPLSCPLEEGETLRIEGTPVGSRTYLAVKGGWQTAVRLTSRSSEAPVRAGDRLDADPGSTPVRRPSATCWVDPTSEALRVIDGPDAGLARDLDGWLGATFAIGRDSNRVGLRLEGPPLGLRADPERPSTPVAPGALQVAGGQGLLLGVACGTMGGYPHVAHVISADRDRLGQLRPGDRVRFRRVALPEARRLDREERAARAGRVLRVAALASDPAAWAATPRGD